MSDPVLPTTDIAWDVAQALLDLCRNLRPALAGVTVSDGPPNDKQKPEHVFLTGIRNHVVEIAGFGGTDGADLALPSDHTFDIVLEVFVFNITSKDGYGKGYLRVGEIIGAIDQATRANPNLGLDGVKECLVTSSDREVIETTEGMHIRGVITLGAEAHLWIE